MVETFLDIREEEEPQDEPVENPPTPPPPPDDANNNDDDDPMGDNVGDDPAEDNVGDDPAEDNDDDGDDPMEDNDHDDDNDFHVSSDEEDDDDDDEDYNPPGANRSQRNTKDFSRTAMVLMKYGITYRGGAELVSAAIADLELATEANITLMIDHTKLYRAAKRLAKNQEAKRNQEVAEGFQGRV